MTRLYDDPQTFTENMLEGFLDLHRRTVVGVPGGVVRTEETPEDKVAVVVGGGSGHYPAFCGVVGPGFADGAVVGNIFTSPSAEDAYQIGRAAASGAGLLMSTGNYAGDVMNFTLAQERLLAEGVDTRLVFVTDDIASAPVEEAHKRRGIAGDFVVFKVAGAAAEEGYDLDEVERVTRHANDRTRTLGVAFGGCTMPGADEPLFTVPPGRMGVGLGIHGEPGIAEDALPRAAELAQRLVDGVLAERPADAGPRVGAILNGLGTTKYEELFVVWRTVSRLLAERGLEVVDPEVGELVTSLDMAGCSMTLVHLDDELERLWCAPASTPAYRKGGVPQARKGGPTRSTQRVTARAAASRPEASEESRRCAATVVAALGAMRTTLLNHEEELGRLDAVAGDGDHGRGMTKGISAALDAARRAADDGGGTATVLAAAGDGWAAKAGGTSGVLWGATLSSIGRRIGDTGGPSRPAAVLEALEAGLQSLQKLGGAKPGDKTMVDAFVPFLDALRNELQGGATLPDAWAGAAETCVDAAAATADLRPRLGRARPLAERSLGTPDAGATSFALCVRAVTATLPAS